MVQGLSRYAVHFALCVIRELPGVADLLDLDDDGIAWVLEINTIPGFTSHSLVPMAAAKAGISMPELTDRIVRMAMARAMCLS